MVNMVKRKVYLTKSDLKRIVAESIAKFVGNDENIDDVIDLSKIDINILRREYRDLRYEPVMQCYGNPMYEPGTIDEEFGREYPADDIIKTLVEKYNLNPLMVRKREAYNNVAIYVVVADKGMNDELIQDDMEKVGYFLGSKTRRTIDNMNFWILHFEPTSRMQADVTDWVKEVYVLLFHWTPYYKIDSIMASGLKPSSENSNFSYPNRVYLIKGNANDKEIYSIGQTLCIHNDDDRNDGRYTLVSVDTRKLDDSVRIYYDPNMDMGLYTETKIPKDAIKKVADITFRKSFKSV